MPLVLVLCGAGCEVDPAEPNTAVDATTNDSTPEVQTPSEVSEAFALADLSANAPPSVAWQAPAEGAVMQVGQPVEFRALVSDDDTPAAEIGVSVALPAGASPLDVAPVPDAEGLVAFTVDGLEPGKNLVILTVYDRYGAIAEAALTVLANRVPAAPVVGIEPESPRTGDDLTASILAAAVDPDTGAVPLEQHAFEWLVDGVPAAGLSGPLVPADRTKAGERWTVVVNANDGSAAGAQAMAAVVIEGSPPSAPVVALAPTAPTVGSMIECSIAAPAVDPDGEELAYLVRWTLDGKVIDDAGTGTTLALAVRVDGAWKALLPVTVGTVVGCRVNATDGLLIGPLAEATATLAAFDACADDAGSCPIGTLCGNTNTVEVVCACAPGWSGPGGASCSDVDECADGTAACPEHSSCANRTSGYACPCDAGWEADPSGTPGCMDVDECATGTHGCDPRSDCSDTDGGYACPCKAGLEGDGLIPGGCLDVDECANGTAACSEVSHCSNTDGGFECLCIDGWKSDSAGGCQDVDECTDGTSGCDPNADCFNGFGSVVCACRQGFAGDGLSCEDVDECTLGLHACDPHATCVNDFGGYACECDSGWTGNGTSCEDLDECAAGSHGCHPAAACDDTDGGYDCRCGPGWEGAGFGPSGCVDVDECATGQAACAADADCIDSDGGYDCVCRQGFVAVGILCMDVDECAAGTAACDPAAICANVDGSYACTCKPGWTGDGRHCTPG